MSKTPNHLATDLHHFVIASVARQSRVARLDSGLQRRFASRNDDSGLSQNAPQFRSIGQDSLLVVLGPGLRRKIREARS